MTVTVEEGAKEGTHHGLRRAEDDLRHVLVSRARSMREPEPLDEELGDVLGARGDAIALSIPPRPGRETEERGHELREASGLRPITGGEPEGALHPRDVTVTDEVAEEGTELLVDGLPTDAHEVNDTLDRMRALDGNAHLFDAASSRLEEGMRRAAAAEEDLARVHAEGRFATRRLFGFEGFIRSSGAIDGRDPQIGCVGGGNHFVELQRVDAILDGHAARAWGISKGMLAIMVHSGSVGLGHAVGGHFMDRARELFPTGVKAPKGGFFPLPTAGPLAEEGLFYLDGMGNAANFAFANRLFLGLMAIRAIEEASGRTVAARNHTLVGTGFFTRR